VEVVRPSDARSFLELAGPLFAGDEARHNLILGIAGTLERRPEVWPVFHLWVVREGERIVAAALQTEPYNLVLADPETDEALDALMTAVRDDEAPIPGIVASVPHAEAAARAWSAGTGRAWDVTLRQGVFALTRALPVDRPPGRSRVATAADRSLLLEWLRAFAFEALPRPEEEQEHAEHMLDTRFTGEDAAMWLWERDGEPVSLAAYSGPTLSGTRVGPVYTPPEHRRRGYASALVAELSAFLLGRGHRACFLYTDLANPTSNAIYERIGYERVAEAAEIRFREP
jgi:predicted GNAT family acetyltransferase